MSICLEWSRLSRLGQRGQLVETQARKVISEISERAGLGAIESHTISGWLRKWIEQKKNAQKAKGTWRRYECHIDAFCEFLGDDQDRLLAWLTPDKVDAFRHAERAAGKSVTSANHALKTLRMALGNAHNTGLVLNNPAKAVEALPSEKTHRQPFNRVQLLKLIEVADSDWEGMIRFGLFYGMRISDAANLLWGNVDLSKRVFIYKMSKTGSTLNNPLHSDVLKYLKKLPRGKGPDAPLFPSLHGMKNSGRNGLSARFRILMHKAGIISEGEKQEQKEGKGRRVFELSFHSLRATAATEGAEAGIDEQDRMNIIGHDNKAVHRGYTQKRMEELRKQIEKIPGL